MMYRDPKKEELAFPLFNKIWKVIKSWDINVPEQYEGYCGATGNHVCAVMDAVTEDNDMLSASEAVYGFAAWLTGRDAPVTFSGKHNAGIAADLVAEFCKVNNLSEPRPDWTTNLTHPSGEIAVAGRGENDAR